MRSLAVFAAILVLGATLPAAPARAQAKPGTLPAPVEILVYKKWIGASGDEADVEADLFCDTGTAYPRRRVNHDKPDGWQIADIPDGGMLCSVLEVERDSFIADTDDCRDLLILPDQGAECTLVNTKVVKRIQMLNRYGLVMMIAVMLGAGLAAVHRYTRS